MQWRNAFSGSFSLENNAAVAAIAQVRIELAKSLDQIGLAVKIDRVPAGFRLHLVDPDRAAALALGREIARLPPFQRFLQGADAIGRLCGVEDQPAQPQQLRFDRIGIGTEYRIDEGPGHIRTLPARVSCRPWCFRHRNLSVLFAEQTSAESTKVHK
jgi:hypothetical protein